MKPVRRTQALTPFGVGALVDFPGPTSLVHCGIDSWPYDENDPDSKEFEVRDENRLAKRLGVSHFVQPIDYRRPARFSSHDLPNLNKKMPFLRFPRWHQCPRCGLMKQSSLNDIAAPRCTGPISTGQEKGKKHNQRTMIQVRFVAACPDGHLQDFPWWEWVLRGEEIDRSQHQLRIQTSGSSSLAGVRVTCERKADLKAIASRTLAGAFTTSEGSANEQILKCKGENPSLAKTKENGLADECEQTLVTLLRGASNLYFPHIVSSIYLPPINESVDESVLDLLEDFHVKTFLRLMSQSNGGEVTAQMAEMVIKERYPERDVDHRELAKAATTLFKDELAQTDDNQSDSERSEVDYRYEEFEMFRRDIQEGYPKRNLMISSHPVNEYSDLIFENFERVSLLHKLRETRAFAGYTRLSTRGAQEYEHLRTQLSRHPKNWLPCVVVRGEGIFLQLREERLEKWTSNHQEFLENRLDSLKANMIDTYLYRPEVMALLTPRYLVLHTLSHLLINQLIFECGYSSASLRERIYSSEGDKDMAGILIYTAAGDSEGTLGGLVRMGKPGKLDGVLERSLKKASWCSADPVCVESSGQGPDSCNLAACHACALLPETSCEEQNRYLDRAVLAGTLGDSSVGFFSEYL